jgi:hypothetical protein
VVAPEVVSAFAGSVGGSVLTMAGFAFLVDRRVVQFTERFGAQLGTLTRIVADALARVERLESLHFRKD